MKRHLTGLFLSAFAALAAFGQTSGAKLEFEVASIKPLGAAADFQRAGRHGRSFEWQAGPPSGGPGTKDPTRYKVSGATRVVAADDGLRSEETSGLRAADPR